MRMRKFFVFLGFFALVISSSCKKKAVDMIVGHWELTRVGDNYYYKDFQLYSIFEFDADGTLRFNPFGEVYEGFYRVNGAVIHLYYGDNDYDTRQLGGRITSMDDNEMQWILDDHDHTKLCFRRTSRSVGTGEDNFIYATVYPSEGGFVRGSGYYDSFDRCTLTAVANPGYVFVNWTEYGYEVSTEADYSFTVYSSRNLVANFERYDDHDYFIDVTANPTEGGTIYGGGTFYENDYCRLNAVANPGYVFTRWTEYGREVSADNTYSFYVTRDRDLVANFEIVYTPSLDIQFEWEGHVFGYGDEVTCTNYEYGFDEFIQHMQIRNNSYEEKRIVIEKEVVQELYGVTSFFCWGVCYGPETNTSLPIAVPAYSLNEDQLSFHAVYDDQVYGVFIVRYYAYEESHPEDRISVTVRYYRFSGTGTNGVISVTGDCWYVLDHQYSDGETIHLENATFGLYGAADDAGHQQLISGGEEGTGDRLRIGQAGLIWTDYSHLYFNLGDTDLYLYGHATSIADGYILDNADIVFSPSSLYINGDCVVSYSTKHLDLNTDMCLFANNESGWDVVHNQTVSSGTVTITNANGNVTAKYIPTLDDNGTPCFYNAVSGRYIYHSGSGTPIFSRGAKGY